MAKTLESLLFELTQSSRMIRLEEERSLDPGLEKILQEHKNITYLGPVAPYRKDVTYNTRFSLIASDKRISPHMKEFCTLISETMDYLLSERGISHLGTANLFEDLMSEASYGKDQDILDSMASGMLKGIVWVKKHAGPLPGFSYSYTKLIMQNLMSNSFTSQEMKGKLDEAWRSA